MLEAALHHFEPRLLRVDSNHPATNTMGTETVVENEYEAPPQPAQRGNPFEGSYTPVRGSEFTRYEKSQRAAAFAIYDDGLDDGAETGGWENEPTGTRSEPRFWQPRFYAAYFDINVSDFAMRLFRSVVPYKPLLGWVSEEEEMDGGTSVPDLYGPVWITTTLVLALSMGAKFAEFLMNVFRRTETDSLRPSISSVEFSRLWQTASLLYSYVFVFPVLLTVFQCLFAKRSLAHNSVRTHPILGTVMVYGYSMTPVVIAALVAIVPVESIQVVAIYAAFVVGALVLILNLWRDVSVEHRSLTYFVRSVAVGAHAAVAFALVYLFYL